MPDPVGELRLKDATGKVVFRVDGTGTIRMDELIVASRRGKELFHVDKDGKLILKELVVVNRRGETIFHIEPTGRVNIGGDDTSGYLRLRDSDGKSRARLMPGLLELRDSTERIRVNLNALGPSLRLFDDNGHMTIHLDGGTGDIILANSDCAEDFEVADGAEVEPGSVMVIEQEGKLRQSRDAYDKRVAGVVSGAGDNHPGIVLGRIPSNGRAMPIALAGKVFCKVDAGQAPIQVGDLLTTSDIPGYAMKAIDRDKSFGCIIGKSLESLKSDKGLIPILVALQ